MIPRDLDTVAAPPAQLATSLPPASTATQYRVQRTDTSVDTIAQQFGVSADAIVKANPTKFADSSNVVPGDLLTIPPRNDGSQSGANTPAATPQQQVDKALADLHAAEQAKPANRMAAEDLGADRADLQTKLNQAVDAEVQARLSERPALSPQQRKALDAELPMDQADHEASIRAAIVARYNGDPGIQQAVDTQEANALLKRVDQTSYDSPKDKFLALDAAMQSASSDQVRTIAARQDIYRQIVQSAADWAAQPYDGTYRPSDETSRNKLSQAASDSSANYVDLLSGVSSQQMRADLINDARPQLEKIAHFSLLYPEPNHNPQVVNTLTNLSSVVGMLGRQDPAGAQWLGSDLASQMTNQKVLAKTEMMGQSSVLLDAVRQSNDPILALSIIEHVRGDSKDDNVVAWFDRTRDQIFKAVVSSNGKVDSDVRAYGDLTGELNSLIKNEGDQMTPDQLNAAIAAYGNKKGADWQKQVADSQKQLAKDGDDLLAQHASLGAWLESHPEDAAAARAALAPMVNDKGAQAAIKMAVQLDQNALQGAQGQNAISFAAQIGTAADDGGRLFIKELGSNYLIHRMDGLSDQLVASNDVATRTRVIGELDQLGNDSQLARVLGIDSKNVIDLKAGTDEMKKSLAEFNALSDAEKNPATLYDQLQKGLGDTNRTLNKISGFENGTSVGNAFRLFGAGAAGLNLASAIDSATASGQSTMNRSVSVASGLINAAGFSQGAAEYAVGKGFASDDGWISKVGSPAVNHVVNYLSGGVSLFQAGQNFFSSDPSVHDNTEGVLNTMIGAGSILWAAGDGVATGEGLMIPALAGSAELGMWAGPIGAGMMALGTMGLMAYQSKKANDLAIPNRVMFLQTLGYQPSAAQALAAWHSKDGASAASMLMQYGKLHDQTPQQTMAWFNGLAADKQKTIAGAMLSALDTVNGDATKFQKTASSDKNWDDFAAHNDFLTGSVDHGIFGSGPGIVLNGMKFGVSADGEEQPASVHQLDVAFQNLLGVNPP